jgi:cell division protein FtsN
MRGVFDDRDFDPVKPQRDTELTLSPATLLGIFFGMVLLCGLFFGLGFAVGRYGPSDAPAAQQAAAGSQTALAASTKPKPSATPQSATQPQRAVVSVPSAGADMASTSVQPGVYPAAMGGSPYGQPQVKPAQPPTEYQPAAVPSATSRMELSSAPVSGLMVQIAAVMHPEDAEVLVGALRKRGYAVSVRRLPADNLIHVQIGPFKSRDEANRWRQKLLNDGYNAIVQP